MKEREPSYEDIFAGLYEEKVRYLVIGGVAVNLYGISRATGDIDIMAALDRENVERIARCMKKLGLLPKVPVQAEDLADPDKRRAWQT